MGHKAMKKTKKKAKKVASPKKEKTNAKGPKAKIQKVISWLQSLSKNKGVLNVRQQRAIDEWERLQLIASSKMDPGTLVDVGHVANAIDVSSQTITRWRSQGFPRDKNGALPTGDLFRWFYEKLKEARKSDKDGKFVDVRIRKTQAQAIREELLLAEEVGRLVDREKIIRNIRAHISMVSRLMQDMPKRLARYTPTKHRKVFIEEADREIKELLKTFSEWKEE